MLSTLITYIRVVHVFIKIYFDVERLTVACTLQIAQNYTVVLRLKEVMD